jgi:hypothetical protein
VFVCECICDISGDHIVWMSVYARVGVFFIIYLQHVPLQCNTTCCGLLLITAVYCLYLVELYRFH